MRGKYLLHLLQRLPRNVLLLQLDVQSCCISHYRLLLMLYNCQDMPSSRVMPLPARRDDGWIMMWHAETLFLLLDAKGKI